MRNKSCKEHLLWIEHESGPAEELPAGLSDSWLAAGVNLRCAYRADGGWWLRIRSGPGPIERLELPADWRLGQMLPAADRRAVNAGLDDRERRLADPFAFALLQWPLVLGLFALPRDGWWFVLHLLMIAWLVLSLLSAYFGRYRTTPQFGGSLILANLSIAAASWQYPGPWAVLWVGVAVLLLYVGQRALLSEKIQAPVS